MNSKIVSVLGIFYLLSQQVQVEAALTCRGCELTNNQTCDFTYKCDDHVEYCETLISKVDGSYSLIFGCGIDKCKGYGKNTTDAGLDKCDFIDANTECWSCCGSDKCNVLNNAFAVLPKNAFSTSTSGGKTSVYDSEDLEDEETIRKVEKKMKLITSSFITTINVNDSDRSGGMTSIVRTTDSAERTISILDGSRDSNGFPSTSQAKTSSTRSTEVIQNSTDEGNQSTSGVETSNEIAMLQLTDRNIYTSAPNDSHSRTTPHESIHNVTHQPFKSSASSSFFTVPIFLIIIITFLYI